MRRGVYNAAMMCPAKVDELPLRSTTPASWALRVLLDPMALLNDHAWLEKKAASNALELLNRWPEPCPPENWVASMTAIARDEVEHLALVVRLLARRGGKLTKSHRSAYASDLRKLVRMGRGNEELMDRLMISALIEARSCERFATLAEHCEDKELAKLYRGLYASEAGHYRIFIGLARELPDAEAVDTRWDEMLSAEAATLASQKPGPAVHSGAE